MATIVSGRVEAKHGSASERPLSPNIPPIVRPLRQSSTCELTSMSDQDRISTYNVNSTLSGDGMRMKKDLYEGAII